MSNIFHLLNNKFYSPQLEEEIALASKVFVLVDSNTLEHVWPIVASTAGLDQVEILEVEPGEQSKSLEICHHLWASLLESGANRSSLLINLGGGVVTDLGGFIASTFKRGIKFINIPSSLLAMVDASSGGKTGINLGHSKNQIGVFNEAHLVLIFSDFLKTLPLEHLRSGYGEMLKHGLIQDKKYWTDLTNIKTLSFEEIGPFIKRSIEIKSEVVTADPFEKGLRKTLNFGHTFGHALESKHWENETPILHGDAVAIGMLIAAELSTRKGMLSKEENREIQLEISTKFSLSPIISIKFDDLIKELKNDKKNTNDKINFTLLNSIGEAVYDQHCSYEELEIAFDVITKLAENNELLA